MKILYFIDQSINSNLSILIKIKAQITCWIEYGVEVNIFSFLDRALYSVSKNGNDNIKIKLEKYFDYLKWSPWKLKSIFETLDYELVYTRWKLYKPFIVSSFLSNNRKYVLEINSNDLFELWIQNKIKYLYNLLTRSILIKKASGLVCVTNELVKLMKPINHNSILISNGIYVTSYPFVPCTDNKKPNLVFIASNPKRAPHGLDKIILMSKFLKEFTFHIIGANGNNRDNLIYHGILSNEKAADIIKNADFGISSLSLYRLKLEEACPLKSRQYLAMGIPIIYGYKDPDIKDDYLFALKLPNSEDNVISNIKLIRQFIFDNFKKQDIRKMARVFAEENLDLKNKEKQRIEFFIKILE